jgi:hypothetical protein
VRVPIAWRKATSGPEHVSYTNGLSTLWRDSVTILSVPGCRGAADLVRAVVTRDLWRLADVGALRAIDVGEPHLGSIAGSVRVRATVLGEEGQAHLELVCMERDHAALAVVVLQPLSERPTELAERIARTVRWPAVPSGP